MSSVRINENMIVNVERSVMESYKNVICDVIRECSKYHNFDFEEECRRQGVGGMYVKLVEKVKKVSERVSDVEGSKLMLPYNGEMDECKCEGVKWYEGLMKQCNANKKEGHKYCGTCVNQSLKNGMGVPTYGNIRDRQRVDLYSYVGPKGSRPISYVEYLNKNGYSIEDAKREALKEGKYIDEMHYDSRDSVKRSRGRPPKEVSVKGSSSSLSSSEVKVNKKGRPKKAEKEITLNDDEDIFASLVASVVEEEVKMEVECEVECEVNKSVNDVDMSSISVASVSDSKKSDKVAKKSDKVAKKAEKDAIKAEKDAIKAEKDAIKAAKDAKKAEKDAIKAEKEAKKAEKEAKKAEKEAKKSDKVAKKSDQVVINSDKDIHVVQSEVEKEVELVAEEIDEDERPKTPIMPDEEEEEEEEEPDIVKRIEYNGVKYLESKNTGVIYNYEQDVVGKRNYATGEIEFEEIDSESEDDE
jgi:hypothetical protein